MCKTFRDLAEELVEDTKLSLEAIRSMADAQLT